MNLDTHVKFTKEETAEYLSKMTLGYPAASAENSEVLVSYYFKPKTKYPPRLYLLYGYWPQRNRRMAGISKQPCLYKRPVGPIEREEMSDCGRMMSNQFEANQIDKMIFRHMEDGFSDTEIQQILDAVLPHCTPDFRAHSPVSEIRKRYNEPNP